MPVLHVDGPAFAVDEAALNKVLKALKREEEINQWSMSNGEFTEIKDPVWIRISKEQAEADMASGEPFCLLQDEKFVLREIDGQWFWTALIRAC